MVVGPLLNGNVIVDLKNPNPNFSKYGEHYIKEVEGKVVGKKPEELTEEQIAAKRAEAKPKKVPVRLHRGDFFEFEAEFEGDKTLENGEYEIKPSNNYAYRQATRGAKDRYLNTWLALNEGPLNTELTRLKNRIAKDGDKAPAFLKDGKYAGAESFEAIFKAIQEGVESSDKPRVLAALKDRAALVDHLGTNFTFPSRRNPKTNELVSMKDDILAKMQYDITFDKDGKIVRDGDAEFLQILGNKGDIRLGDLHALLNNEKQAVAEYGKLTKLKINPAVAKTAKFTTTIAPVLQQQMELQGKTYGMEVEDLIKLVGVSDKFKNYVKKEKATVAADVTRLKSSLEEGSVDQQSLTVVAEFMQLDDGADGLITDPEILLKKFNNNEFMTQMLLERQVENAAHFREARALGIIRKHYKTAIDDVTTLISNKSFDDDSLLGIYNFIKGSVESDLQDLHPEQASAFAIKVGEDATPEEKAIAAIKFLGTNQAELTEQMLVNVSAELDDMFHEAVEGYQTLDGKLEAQKLTGALDDVEGLAAIAAEFTKYQQARGSDKHLNQRTPGDVYTAHDYKEQFFIDNEQKIAKDFQEFQRPLAGKWFGEYKKKHDRNALEGIVREEKTERYAKAVRKEAMTPADVEKRISTAMYFEYDKPQKEQFHSYIAPLKEQFYEKAYEKHFTNKIKGLNNKELASKITGMLEELDTALYVKLGERGSQDLRNHLKETMRQSSMNDDAKRVARDYMRNNDAAIAQVIQAHVSPKLPSNELRDLFKQVVIAQKIATQEISRRKEGGTLGATEPTHDKAQLFADIREAQKSGKQNDKPNMRQQFEQDHGDEVKAKFKKAFEAQAKQAVQAEIAEQYPGMSLQAVNAQFPKGLDKHITDLVEMRMEHEYPNAMRQHMNEKYAEFQESPDNFKKAQVEEVDTHLYGRDDLLPKVKGLGVKRKEGIGIDVYDLENSHLAEYKFAKRIKEMLDEGKINDAKKLHHWLQGKEAQEYLHDVPKKFEWMNKHDVPFAKMKAEIVADVDRIIAEKERDDKKAWRENVEARNEFSENVDKSNRVPVTQEAIDFKLGEEQVNAIAEEGQKAELVGLNEKNVSEISGIPSNLSEDERGFDHYMQLMEAGKEEEAEKTPYYRKAVATDAIRSERAGHAIKKEEAARAAILAEEAKLSKETELADGSELALPKRKGK